MIHRSDFFPARKGHRDAIVIQKRHIQCGIKTHQTVADKRETQAWLALLVMRHGTICLWRLATHVTTVAQGESTRRRFYRFFQFVKLNGAMAARVVVDQSRLRKFEQWLKWIFCLTAARIIAANQELR